MTAALVVLCTGCALICVIAAWVSAKESTRATHEADGLRHSRGRIVALEHSVEVLDQRVKRAVGTAYEARSRARAKTLDAARGSDDVFRTEPADDETPEEFQAMLDAQRGGTPQG